MQYIICTISSPVCHGGNFLVFLEKFAECRLVRKMKLFRNLCHRNAVVLKHGHSLVYQFIADDRMRRLTCHLLDNTCKMLVRDALGFRIKIDIVFFHKMS